MKVYKSRYLSLCLAFLLSGDLAWGGVVTECYFNNVTSYNARSKPDGKEFYYPTLQYAETMNKEKKEPLIKISTKFTNMSLVVRFGVSNNDIYAEYWLNPKTLVTTFDAKSRLETPNIELKKYQTVQNFGELSDRMTLLEDKYPPDKELSGLISSQIITRIGGIKDGVNTIVTLVPLGENFTRVGNSWDMAAQIATKFETIDGSYTDVKGIGLCTVQVTSTPIAPELIRQYGAK
jgi:hypothetical protein